MAENSTFTIHQFEIGPMENFIYIIEDHATRRAAVVDPAWHIDEIMDEVNQRQLKVTDILITHCHHDHINGVEELVALTDAQVHLMKAENDYWSPGFLKPHTLYSGDIIQLGETEIRALHTPGHSKGSACFHIGDQLITGDTMFVFGCGHCRLGGSDPEVLFNSLKKLKAEIPDNTKILPGHNYAPLFPVSTMGAQKQGNPFLHFDNQYDFIKYRMKIHDQIRSDPYEAISEKEMPAHCAQYHEK